MLGVSAASVGQQLRTSIFGAKAGIYKNDGEDYEINVRFNAETVTTKTPCSIKASRLEISPLEKLRKSP